MLDLEWDENAVLEIFWERTAHAAVYHLSLPFPSRMISSKLIDTWHGTCATVTCDLD